MITEEQINKICLERHLTKLSISKNPCWIDKNKQEGIELQLGKIKSFWNKDGEKKYDEPASEIMQKTIDMITGGNNEKSTKIEDKENEKKTLENKDIPDTKTEQLPATAGAITVIELPEVVTSLLLQKWEKFRAVERMLWFQNTPKNQIFHKPVGNGKSAAYVKGNYMIKEANVAFLFDWRFIQQGISIGNESVAVYGFIEANVDGRTLSRPAVGYEEINKKMTAQLAIKSATTDAIKKGLSLFGFNSDVYSGEV